MLKGYETLTFNSLREEDVGGKRIGTGSRFCFLLRASQQNPGDSPAIKPPRQAHCSLCNASLSPHNTGGGGAGLVDAGGKCQNKAGYKSERRDKAL